MPTVGAGLGRMFNFQLLDMVELGLAESKLMAEFKGVEQNMFGSKPCLTFHGDAFDTNPDFKRLKSLFIDFFRGPVVPTINLGARVGMNHHVGRLTRTAVQRQPAWTT